MTEVSFIFVGVIMYYLATLIERLERRISVLEKRPDRTAEE